MLLKDLVVGAGRMPPVGFNLQPFIVTRSRDHEFVIIREQSEVVFYTCHKYSKIKWLTASNGVEDENLGALDLAFPRRGSGAG